MSFLDNLRNQKRSLKPTTTVLTYPDGSVFHESNFQSTKVFSTQYGFVVDTKPDKIPAKITENIFLGSQDCCEWDVLQTYKISYVLSVGIDCLVKYSDVNYKFVNCLDLPDTNLNDVLKECLSFIMTADQNHCYILVHCNAGVSRSAAVVIGYLVSVLGYDYEYAFNVVKKQRPCIRPNDGFVKQLKKLSDNSR